MYPYVYLATYVPMYIRNLIYIYLQSLYRIFLVTYVVSQDVSSLIELYKRVSIQRKMPVA